MMYITSYATLNFSLMIYAPIDDDFFNICKGFLLLPRLSFVNECMR